MAAHYNKRRTGKRPALVYFRAPYREGVIPQLQMTASAPTLSFTEALIRESAEEAHCPRGVVMKCTLIGTLAAAAAAAAISASSFVITAAAQSDQEPTHAELQQRWADAAIETQLKSMKTSLKLKADQEELWGAI